MNLIGLCGETNIEQLNKHNYFCEKAKIQMCTTDLNVKVMCSGCKFSFSKEAEENTEEKTEQPHETIKRLCDMVAKLHIELYHAKNDIGALLWLNGNCEYCANGQVEKYCGAERWTCKLGDGTNCKPVWRGIIKESYEE